MSLIAISSSAFAGDYNSIAELGVKFYSATATPSLTGSYGFFMDLRSERKKGIFRPQAAAELEYSTGTSRIAEGDTPTYSMVSGAFLGGINLFVFQDAQFQPFLGGNGILGWNILRLTGQQADVEANTEGLAYGYEVSAGCDIRRSSGAENAVRFRTSYWKTTSTLAGSSGFLLSGWRVTIGLVF